MPQMRLALPAHHFGARHPVASIGLLRHLRFRGRPPKTRPARPRIKLRFRLEQRLAAAYALIRTGRLGLPEFAGERRLGALAARDVILLGRQLRAPLGVALRYFLAHAASSVAHLVSILRQKRRHRQGDALLFKSSKVFFSSLYISGPLLVRA